MEPNELKDELIRIERSLWKNEPNVYHQTYIPEAILIFPNVGRIGRSKAVDAIRKENKAGRAWAEVNLDNVATFGHSQQGQRDTAELADGGYGHLRVQAEQECHNVGRRLLSFLRYGRYDESLVRATSILAAVLKKETARKGGCDD